MRLANRICPSLALALGLCIRAQADLTPLGRIDTESLQSLTYGLSAFSRSAGFPYTLADLNQTASRMLAIPNLAGLDVRQPVSVHLLVDDNAPRATAHIASLKVVELTDNGASMLATLNAIYTRREEKAWGLSFSGRREGLSVADPLAVAIRGGKAYVSETAEALVWAQKAGRPTLAVPAPNGRLTITLVPTELAACLSATNATLTAPLPISSLLPTGQVTRALSRLPALLRECNSLALSIDANGHALSLTLTLDPKPASSLHAWTAGMRPPSLWYSSLAPRTAPLVTVAGYSSRGGWRERLGWTLENQLPTMEDLVGDSLIGETVSYLSNTPSGDGLAFVSVAKVLNPADSRRRLAERLAGATLPSGVAVRRAAGRTYTGTDVQCFTLTNTAPATIVSTSSIQPSVLVALGSLLARVTVLESAVVGQDLALVAGPPGSIEPIIDNLKVEKSPFPSVTERCRRFSPDLPADATSVSTLGPVALLRQIVAVLPGYKPSQLDQFSLPGDGLVAWSSNKDGKYVGTLQIAANEIDALQGALTRGRPVIQELLMQMVMQQVLRQPTAERDRNTDHRLPAESPSPSP